RAREAIAMGDARVVARQPGVARGQARDRAGQAEPGLGAAAGHLGVGPLELLADEAGGGLELARRGRVGAQEALGDAHAAHVEGDAGERARARAARLAAFAERELGRAAADVEREERR